MKNMKMSYLGRPLAENAEQQRARGRPHAGRRHARRGGARVAGPACAAASEKEIGEITSSLQAHEISSGIRYLDKQRIDGIYPRNHMSCARDEEARRAGEPAVLARAIKSTIDR